MIKSAKALENTFAKIAYVSFLENPSQTLREKVAEIGRDGEKEMLEATNGINTHKGAIWAIGLLTASFAMLQHEERTEKVMRTAGELARYSDRYVPTQTTNGTRVQKRYGVLGAKAEAEQGFPHIQRVALPALYAARKKGVPEQFARIDTLLALMASVDDTCILHRGGIETLLLLKEMAGSIVIKGGVSTLEGWKALADLDNECLVRRASPGGSADLLAATIFLDSLCKQPEPFYVKSSILI
jgi:triphosphoribosyl-dephospho-CoA synthase